MVKKKVVYVNYGLGSSYDNLIELNKKLKYNKSLHDKILNHELNHSGGKYSKQDYINDFHSENSHFFEALWFAIKNPESLVNYMPFMYSYYLKKMTYNLSSIFPLVQFGLIFCIFFTIVGLFGGMNPFILFVELIFWYLYFVLIINVCLLVYTHFYVKFS